MVWAELKICRTTMSYLLPHLESAAEVEGVLKGEEERVVVLRFGRDATCIVHDEMLASVAELVKNFACIYLVDIDSVSEFNAMYELEDECSTMFFFRNKHIMVDLGTGDNNKITWQIADKQEFIDIVETVYVGATKGKGLVVSPKDYSTKHMY